MNSNHNHFKAIIALTLFVYVSTAYAVKFHSYVNEKGETVFSNVPRKCTRNSSLTCLEYHPVFAQEPSKSAAAPESESRHVTKPSRRAENDQAHSMRRLPFPENPGIDQQFDILNKIVEMNKIVDEYFPAKSSQETMDKARQQQQDILDALQMIRNVSSEEESPSIEKAIDILRSNLIE
jgi:hypothetical protein